MKKVDSIRDVNTTAEATLFEPVNPGEIIEAEGEQWFVAEVTEVRDDCGEFHHAHVSISKWRAIPTNLTSPDNAE